MTAHPKFEELAEFIFAKTIDAEYFRMAARINAHLSVCPDCKKIYDVMLAAADQAEAYVRCAALQEENLPDNETAVQQTAEQNTVRAGQKIDLQELIQSGRTFLLKVRSLTEIIADELTMYHPMQLATVKSTGSRGEQGEIRSVLADESGNRIRIDEDGSLSLYFDRTMMPVGQMVVLIPEAKAQQEMVGIVTEYDRNTTRVSFEGIEPGEFRVLVG